MQPELHQSDDTGIDNVVLTSTDSPPKPPPRQKRQAPYPPSSDSSSQDIPSIAPPQRPHRKKKAPEPPTQASSDNASVSYHQHLSSLQNDTLMPQRPARRSSKTHQAPSMTNVATTHGYSVVNVPSDGSCFFHAVGKTMSTAGLQQISASQIRSELVEYFEISGGDLYSPFVTNPAAVPQKCSPKKSNLCDTPALAKS